MGFKGSACARVTASDWGANHATTDLNAGVDMEMPGGGLNGIPPQYFTKTALDGGHQQRRSIQVARVTEAAGRILFEMDKFGLLTGNSKHNVTAETTCRQPADRPADRLQDLRHSCCRTPAICSPLERRSRWRRSP